MNENWIPLQSIPQSGKQLVYEDQDKWVSILSEFEILFSSVEKVRAEIFVQPMEGDVLFRGKLSGKIVIPCYRCMQDSSYNISSSFDSLEPLPDIASRWDNTPSEDDQEIDSAVVRLAPNGNSIEINPFALAWEEFSLVLPVKPICTKDCKGLCPSCGINRNVDTCNCLIDEGDPRLAALRGLSIKKK